MSRLLVTGAAGFIGSHVAENLAEDGHEVIAVDNLSGGFLENIPRGVTFVKSDVTHPDTVSRLFKEYGPFQYVYHLAAYAAEGLSHYIRGFNYINNVVGSVNLLNESIRNSVECFVFTSSIAVYGTNQTPMHESLVPLPEDPYGIAKYAVELDLKAAHEMFGIDYIIFRPHNVYGERQNIADRYRNVIGIFMNQILHGEPMTVFGDGTQTRAFSYIADVAPAIAQAPYIKKAQCKTFNIGADTPYTVNDLVHLVAKAFDMTPEVRYLPARKEVVHAFCDHTLIRSVFQLARPTPLSIGIKRMADWVKSIGPRQPIGFDSVEVDKNFPLGWRQYIASLKENR
ncbi:MAG: NAD-dependent epimerase/dehydratase family protein [wastewater metagenome]|nr:NAD-dependent epimerase/dehydratase family protein [Candidatus Loosdrechtia aerotolerans]